MTLQIDPILPDRLPPPPRAGEQRLLTPDVERKLVLAAAKGNPAARSRLVDAFLPLIASVAARYRRPGVVDRVELIQEGVVGLLRALRRFDPDHGNSFWAYASWWVRQAMQQLVAEMVRPIVLSDRALRQLAKIKHARGTFMQANSREPSTPELSAASGIEMHHVEALLAAERPALGFDEPTRVDEGNGGGGTLGDLVADPRADDELERVDRWLDLGDLRELAADLTERERAIICARYGIGCEAQTLREVAASLQLSAERVRQIEQEALGKLRAFATA